MECEDTIKLLPSYLDNEMIPVTQMQIEEHLSHCLRCREELNYMSSIQTKIRQAFQYSTANIFPSARSWAKLSYAIETSKTRKDNSFFNIVNEWLSWHSWQTLTATAVVVLLAVGFLFGTVILPGIERGAATNISATSGLDKYNPAPAIGRLPPMTIQTNGFPDTAYQYGETVEINLTFTNLNAEARAIDHFPPEINIVQFSSAKTVATAQVVQSFQAGGQGLTLQPQATGNFTLTWDQKDESGKQVSSGWYTINVEMNTHSVSENSGSDQIQSTPGRIYIMPPEGVLQKTIEINKSITVNNIAITLEKIELSTTGAKVFVVTPSDQSRVPGSQGGTAPSSQGINTPSSTPSSPGITVPSAAPSPLGTNNTSAGSSSQGTNPSSIAVPPPLAMPPAYVEAEYSIDKGPFASAFMFSTTILPDNTMLRIWNLDPVSKNARSLTFRINSINTAQGPWEFEIPLN